MIPYFSVWIRGRIINREGDVSSKPKDLWQKTNKRVKKQTNITQQQHVIIV